MKQIKIYIVGIIFCLIANSCGDFGDTNIDPNNPSTVSTGFLLTKAQKDLMSNTHDEWIGGRVTFLNAQYWSQNNYTEESRYNPRQDVTNTHFTSFYTEPLNDLNEIITVNKNNPNKGEAANQTAIARILKVWMFHYMTDLWGPIPYKEALKGSENRSPKYDAQKDIYLDLLKELNESIAQMRETDKSFGSADVVFNGNMKQWKKFANSLILRIAMRMSDVETATAKTAVEKAAQDAFSSNADNAYFAFLNGQPNNSPLHQSRVNRGDADFCISNVLIDNTLNPVNDPRVAAFADKTAADGKYKGRPYGQNSAVAASEMPEVYSQPSGASVVVNGGNFNPNDVLAPNAKATFMNYAEVCFILAEAKERGWAVTGTAQEWYDKGITASMNEWGIEDKTAINQFLAQKDIAYLTAKGDWKQKIGVQKWVALYPQGLQGWAEWRRLDFDKFILPVGGAIGDLGTKVAPMRLNYPQEEQTKNSANYQAAVTLLGADNLKTRLWWDIK
jgi:Starch-binding associating with outer membrane